MFLLILFIRDLTTFCLRVAGAAAAPPDLCHLKSLSSTTTSVGVRVTCQHTHDVFDPK